jgi:hypothetical protein
VAKNGGLKMIHLGELWITLNISAMPLKTSSKNSRSSNQALETQKNQIR